MPQLAEFISWLSKQGNNCASLSAYLSMMAVRLIELRRILKPTGSIYLHCNPTASHYLKILMDNIFGYENFLNEIVWCFSERERILKTWNKKHDDILYYAKEQGKQKTFFERVLDPYSNVTKAKFKYHDENGWYQIRGKNITNSPIRKTDGLRPEHETQHAGLTYRQYLKGGVPPKDWWVISIINKASSERLGYPTQKPLSLLEKIIQASSDINDVVLDPFCGCGTTIDASQKLGRKWIGIDVTWLAINLVEKRLKDRYGEQVKGAYKVIGQPTDLASARDLANRSKKEFEIWAITLVGASSREHNGGVDGIMGFVDGNREVKKIVVQVKGGHNLNPSIVRDLIGTVKKENASIGLLITLNEPTSGMIQDAIHNPPYKSQLWNRNYPSIQIRTIKELLVDKKYFNLPPQTSQINLYKQALKAKEQMNTEPML